MLYHITSKETAKQILKEGLKPSIGENSKIANETEAVIYLCSRKSVPFWQILLKQYTVLEVDETDLDLSAHYKYTNYDEYLIKTPIPADKIKRTRISKPAYSYMRKLCLMYLHVISCYCRNCARYYDYIEDYDEKTKKEKHDCLDYDGKLLVHIMNRLDYSKLEKQEIRDEIKMIGDSGQYSLCDYYYDTDNRLYQQLLHYPDDDMSKTRKQINKYIRENLKYCLRVNTGGWCG